MYAPVPIAAAMLARISLLNLRSNFKKTSVKSLASASGVQFMGMLTAGVVS